MVDCLYLIISFEKLHRLYVESIGDSSFSHYLANYRYTLFSVQIWCMLLEIALAANGLLSHGTCWLVLCGSPEPYRHLLLGVHFRTKYRRSGAWNHIGWEVTCLFRYFYLGITTSELTYYARRSTSVYSHSLGSKNKLASVSNIGVYVYPLWILM